ncbi:GerMN domain-containing protein [Cetobacterium somerae]|uniref:GerMN domain-containing protein n=1 Tax=Cetobacterium sp. NK01 TaxID=2993530 RepID=UPI002116467B|nr:GerMN domain-containing protein [Cetobacterium sp. NK01]MCQ8211732.1 GerMN domain-containing protein [Cetobacterium sp. NK01]
MSYKLKSFLVILIVIVVGTGIYSNKLNKKSEIITPISTPTFESMEVTKVTTPIFFPNLKQGKLNSEDINLISNLSNQQDILKDILFQLIKKLEDKNIIKKENFKYEVYLKNRTLYLDLDSKILSSAKTPQEELLLIYSFVNSLLTPGGADNVVLLINGIPTDKVNFININKSYKLNSNI